MLRTYFLQNEDWFANSDHPFSRLRDMDSEIAELRTMTKVSRLRKQIECREEGAWMVVKDVPDENAPNGLRKVTAYGRTRRSVVRSVSSNSNFQPGFSSENISNEPLIQLPEESEPTKEIKPNSVEISEVFDEPLRSKVVNVDKSAEVEKSSKKKTSVVTLGEGNIVLLDPEKESNFHISGISKGKVADVVSTLEKSLDKKHKKVGFCKTEVHFAPDSGKINIVETDEKPPPTQVYRRKKRPRGSRKSSEKASCLPKTYFGEADLGEDSNLSNESDKEELKSSFPPPIGEIPKVKEIFPAFEKNIKSECKDVKYRHSSPEKSGTNFGLENFDDKEFFRKLKQPSFRERFLKESEAVGSKSSNISLTSINDNSPTIKPQNNVLHFNGTSSNLNDYKTKSPLLDTLNIDKANVSTEKEFPELRYTELFKLNKKDIDHDLSSGNQGEHSKVYSPNTVNGADKKSNQFDVLSSFTDDVDETFNRKSRVPIDQDVKSNISFGNINPKLQSLIKNSIEHEFQMKQKHIIRKKSFESKMSDPEPDIIKSSVNIRVSPTIKKERNVEAVSLPKKEKRVSQVKVNSESSQIHEFQKKQEEITKHIHSDPLYSSKSDFQHKDASFLLNEEPIPPPRLKSPPRSSVVPDVPKPKPRTVITTSRSAKGSARLSVAKTTLRPDTSSLSKRTRSRESLVRVKDSNKVCPRASKELRKKAVSPQMESYSLRSNKTNVETRKLVRAEPLRSFEKVSNGWVGVLPSKKEEKSTPQVTKTYSGKPVIDHTSQHTSSLRKSTQSSALKATHSIKSDGKSVKQFSLSREHLSSAKLVKELSPRKGARVKPEVRIIRPKTAKDSSQSRLRRDSNDSIVQADEEDNTPCFTWTNWNKSTEKKLQDYSDSLEDWITEMSGGTDEMTASYTEICAADDGRLGLGEPEGDGAEGGAQRPSQLELLNRLDGTVAKEGAMITFVADDLESKLRLASPRGILAALEAEACAVAASVDSLTESLSDTLHGISSMTVECLEVYTGVVCKTCDSIDANIKAMYQLMAKSEELSKAMAPLYRLSAHIKNIKHLLDLIEASPS